VWGEGKFAWNGVAIPASGLLTFLESHGDDDITLTTHWLPSMIEQQVAHYDDSDATRIFCKVDDGGRIVPPLCVITSPLIARRAIVS